jgi:hypothetical protein
MVPTGDSVILVRQDGAARVSSSAAEKTAHAWWATFGSDLKSPSVIMKALDIKDGTFYRHLKALRDENVVTVAGTETRPLYAMPSPPPGTPPRTPLHPLLGRSCGGLSRGSVR